VEDCRHLSRRLEADLLAAGEVIVRVSAPAISAFGARAVGQMTGATERREKGERSL
jgi:hypothetical protein